MKNGSAFRRKTQGPAETFPACGANLAKPMRKAHGRAEKNGTLAGGKPEGSLANKPDRQEY